MKKSIDKSNVKCYIIQALESAEQNMREWRNRQTRTFEGRVGQLVRVQVPFLAPRIQVERLGFIFYVARLTIRNR